MRSLLHGLTILRLSQKYRSSEDSRQEAKRARPAPNLPFGKTPTTLHKNWRISVKPRARAAANAGDKAATIEQFKQTGGTRKACHDNYKSRGYLY